MKINITKHTDTNDKTIQFDVYLFWYWGKPNKRKLQYKKITIKITETRIGWKRIYMAFHLLLNDG